MSYCLYKIQKEIICYVTQVCKCKKEKKLPHLRQLFFDCYLRLVFKHDITNGVDGCLWDIASLHQEVFDVIH